MAAGATGAAGDAGEVEGTWNFRDVAGIVDGITTGLLLRSGELSALTERGRAELHRLGVSDVADLRSGREVQRHGPGLVGGDIQIHLLPFFDPPIGTEDDGGDAPHEHAFARLMTDRPDAESVTEAASRYMTEEYRRFPTLPGAHRAVHRVITLLGAGRTVLAHCLAGKDRTGLTVAVVLAAAGADRDAILADYLRSNDAVPQLRARILELIGDRAPEAAALAEARLTEEVLGVRPHYLDAAWAGIEENYGSLDGFLTAAGLSTADLGRLRSALRAS